MGRASWTGIGSGVRADRKVGGRADAEAPIKGARQSPGPTEQQSRNQSAGDKITSGTFIARCKEVILVCGNYENNVPGPSRLFGSSIRLTAFMFSISAGVYWISSK